MKKDIWNGQKGAVLIIALIILLVLTLIGINSISTTHFETNVSGNERSGIDAFYAAEAGAEDGTQQVRSPLPLTLTPIARKALGECSFYWSGTFQDKPCGVPPKSLGVYHRSGYDSSWAFTRVQVNSSGESLGANKEVEVQLTYGPIPAGTNYND